MKRKHQQMYLRMAKAVAETSSAKRLKVGAVAVKNNMVIASGYNGLPSSISGSCEERVYWYEGDPEISDEDWEKEWRYNTDSEGCTFKLVSRPEVHHAEQNLLLNLAKSTESSIGCTIFLTHSPCPSCCLKLVDTGVSSVYYEQEFRDTSGIKYLTDAGIKVEKL